MQRLVEAARRVSLEDKRTWRIALLLVFALGMCSQFLVYGDLADKPAGRIQEWYGSEPWFYSELGRKIVERNDWSLSGRNLFVTREMLKAAPERDWTRWSGNKMPRGALGIYILAGSFGMTASMAAYQLLSMMAGALVGALCASATAFLFGSRRVGLLAGIVVSSLQGMILASHYPGPWIWEALAFAALLASHGRIRADHANPAEWLLFGVVCGLGIWLRPLFFIAPLLLLSGTFFRRTRPALSCVVAVLLPLLICAGALSVRNHNAKATLIPVVGQQGLEFFLGTNPGALRGPAVPSDVALLGASGGSLERTVWLTLTVGAYRDALPGVLLWKVRELVGARDVASSVNPEYVRSQSRVLRQLLVPTDAVVAAGWGGLVMLVCLGRFPRVLAAVMGLLFLDGLLFGASGFDRLMLVLCFAMCACAGCVIAWDMRRRLTAMPFVFLSCWAVAHVVLQIDDHARGTRYRAVDFINAASDYRRSGRERQFREEMRSMERVRRVETDMEGYWNTIP
ncbi:hypothetical protein IT570_14355 [Candidatus Sumerlaeota bacterium]|nr:hypothetical protein [Candidatus Sumerlaeota bacterium]